MLLGWTLKEVLHSDWPTFFTLTQSTLSIAILCFLVAVTLSRRLPNSIEIVRNSGNAITISRNSSIVSFQRVFAGICCVVGDYFRLLNV